MNKDAQRVGNNGSIWRGDIGLFQTTDGDWRVLNTGRVNSDYDETLYWGPSKEIAQNIFDKATGWHPSDDKEGGAK